MEVFMSENIHKSTLKRVISLIRDRIIKIQQLQKEIPRLEETKQDLEWILEEEEKAPQVTITHPSEEVLHQLSNLDSYLTQNPIIADEYIGPAVYSTSGTGTTSTYYLHVSRMPEWFPDNAEVSKWHEDVKEGYIVLREKQDRFTQANERLNKLNRRLTEMHERIRDVVLSTSAQTQSPIEGAEIIREILVSFKGDLIRRCKSGNGATYKRIAENLAVDTDPTREAIVDQQIVYDDLHSQLSEIAKSRVSIAPELLQQLLSRLDDHILIVTGATDPNKIGIQFL
jgi:hypothetical protein